MTALTKLLINQKDLDCAVDCFEKVVRNVAKNGNEIQQANLLTKLKDLTKFMMSRKADDIATTLEVKPVAKKIKLNSPREVQVPNEIWLKIMNYLPTNDIFGTVALLNKNLNGLTLDSKALKYLSFDSNLQYPRSNLDQALAVLKRSTGLVGLTINQTDHWEIIIQEVLNSDIKSLKSLKVVGTQGYFCHFNDCSIH